MSTTDSPAETLRRAAKKIRETAGAADPGPWEVGPSFGARDSSVYIREVGSPIDWVGSTKVYTSQVSNKTRFRENATHIALWHPGVALAFAEWLEHTADSMSDEHAYEHEFPERVNYRFEVLAEDTGGHLNRPSEWTAALAAARAILGESAPERVGGDAR